MNSESSLQDVIIVGAGPAGIFASMQLASRGVKRILVLERGTDLDRRRCPRPDLKGCSHCAVCHVLSGWGGAGAYSDGKLTLSPQVGGLLGEHLSPAVLNDLIAEVDGIFLRFGAPRDRYFPRGTALDDLLAGAEAAGLEFVSCPVRHMGTDGARLVLARMRDHLREGVTVLFGQHVARVVTEDGQAAGVMTEDGRLHRARFVILAPGRGGAAWLASEGRRLGLTSTANPVDIGVRVEVPASVLEPITSVAYEAKLRYTSKLFGDQVRTFCMCPYGEVVMESVDSLHTVNGQSFTDRRTGNTNFAILVSTQFTEPFDDPITYGRHVAGLANLLAGGVLVQRLGDLNAGRRSTRERMRHNGVRPTLAAATPGDLSFALPYRHLSDIREMIGALECMAPGIDRPETLLYGVETKFYSIRLEATAEMETKIRNLFAVGDGAGVSRGLVQASSSGLLAARAIAERLGLP